MVADFPDAICAHRRTDCVAYLARTSRRDSCLYCERGTKRICGRFRKWGWRTDRERNRQILAKTKTERAGVFPPVHERN